MTAEYPPPRPIEIIDDSAGHPWSAYVLCWFVGAVVTVIAQVSLGMTVFSALGGGVPVTAVPFLVGVLHVLGPLAAVCLLPKRAIALGRGAWVAGVVPGPLIAQIAISATLLQRVSESFGLTEFRLLPADGGPFDPTLLVALVILTVPTLVVALIIAHIVGWIRFCRLRHPDPFAPL